MEKNNGSKELNDIFEAINKWVKKHKNNVQFYGSFCAFKGKDFDVIDDRMLAFGIKEVIQIDLKEFTKLINKEKEEFVNW